MFKQLKPDEHHGGRVGDSLTVIMASENAGKATSTHHILGLDMFFCPFGNLQEEWDSFDTMLRSQPD